jgi:hypothetical protein
MPARKTAAAKGTPEVFEIDGVPTAAGLARMGREYAYRVERGITITAKGHALLGNILRERGLARRESP